MPKRFCSCHGCPACGTTSGSHGMLYDADATGTLKCPACQQRAAARKNRPGGHKGYGGDYQRNRRIMIARAKANGEPCWKCGRPFAPGEQITADHKVPLRDGGTSELSNLAPAHRDCNTAWNRGERVIRP